MSEPDRNEPVREGNVSLGARERRFLSETAQVEDESMPTFALPVLAVFATALSIFLLWASVARVNEVAQAQGEILPIGRVKVVQHLDGGAVEAILVEERDAVEEGQELVRMEGAQPRAELRQMEARLAGLRARASRLDAFAGRKPTQAPPGGAARADEGVDAAQRDILRAQEAARASAVAILDRQIEQRSRRVDQLVKSLEVAKGHQALTAEVLKMREELAAKQLVTRTVLLETRRASITAEGEVERIAEEIGVIRAELEEYRSRRADTLNQLRRDALSEMGLARSELAEVEESVERLRARVERLVVRAPNRGLVQDIKVFTVGQVLQPGSPLMQIVPTQAPLEAEIRIQPRDIGFVRVNQLVNMRVSSFDYARYGFATGHLKRISASSVTGEDGKPFYRAWVLFDAPYVGGKSGRNPLQAGMGLEAEIVTGEKTVLNYLSKPVIDVFSRSLIER